MTKVFYDSPEKMNENEKAYLKGKNCLFIHTYWLHLVEI